MTNFINIATDALRRGFSIIPLKPASKDPLPGIGVTQRTRSVDVVSRAIEVPEKANVGICADENYVILETDDEARLRELIRNTTGHELPITLASAARHNRSHFFFKATPEALAAGNFQVPGLFEARFVNAYVVGAGSLHPSGTYYKWLNDYEPVALPAWLLTALQTLHGAERQRNPIDVDLHGTTTFGEGSRHYALTSAAGKLWDGEMSEEELFERLWDINVRRCVPAKTVEHVMQIARYYVNRAEPNDPGPTVLLGGRELNPYKSGPRGDLPQNDRPILESKGEGYGEWFPRGEVSLICAPSGMGKTKMMLGLLEQLRKGEAVFGHPATTADYKILSADRSMKALRRSAQRCHLDEAAIMHRANRLLLRDSRPRWQVLDVFLKEWELEGQLPDVVFVDGMDMWVPKAAVSDFDVVTKFLEELAEIAEKWNVAVIGTVGSPKQKLKDKYAQNRDQVMGSIGWGRKVETIGLMSLVDSEDNDSTRKAVWLPREGKSEVYYFKFEADGRFVETTIDSVSEPKEPDGVADTKAAKVDYQAQMIAIIQALPAGTELTGDMFPWLTKSTRNTYLRELSMPAAGWVGKINGKWVAAGKTN